MRFWWVLFQGDYYNASTEFDAQSINDIEGFNFYEYFSEFPDERDVFINGTPTRINGFGSVQGAGTPTITTLSISNNSWDGVFVEGETYSFFGTYPLTH